MKNKRIRMTRQVKKILIEEHILKSINFIKSFNALENEKKASEWKLGFFREQKYLEK